MGKADIITRTYIRENAVFADAVNYLIYHGQSVIDPEKLKEMDSAELAVLTDNIEKQNGKRKPKTIEKYRDSLKTAVVMEDEKAAYAVIGIEEQTKVHYAMPVKNMIYDALEYGKQVSEMTAAHKKKMKEKILGDPPTDAEFLSGFYKNDRLKPVITIVIHFGAEEWDAPLSIREMLSVQDQSLLNYVQDYKIHLIDPSKMTDQDLEKFQTSLGTVLGYIKYSDDKEQFKQFKEKQQGKRLETNAVQVIKEITGIPIEMDEKEEEQDMCKAFDEMLEDSKNEGKCEGRLEGRLEVLSQLVKQGLLTIEIAAAQINLTPEELKKAMNL